MYKYTRRVEHTGKIQFIHETYTNILSAAYSSHACTLLLYYIFFICQVDPHQKIHLIKMMYKFHRDIEFFSGFMRMHHNTTFSKQIGTIFLFCSIL